MKKTSLTRILLKTLMHFVLTVLTGGLWFIGLVIYYIVKD